MNELLRLLAQFGRLFWWWFTVSPWERAVRVRAGKKDVLLGPGMHVRLPLVDDVYLQSVRRRIVDVPSQTVTTQDGRTVTVGCSVGYAIDDLLLLYRTLHNVHETISNIVQGSVAEYLHTHALAECRPSILEAAATQALDVERYGLGGARVRVTDFAVVRTYRLLMDRREAYIRELNLVNQLDPAKERNST